MADTQSHPVSMNGVQEVPRSNRGTPTTDLSTKEALRTDPEGLLIRVYPYEYPNQRRSGGADGASFECIVHAPGRTAEHRPREVGVHVGRRGEVRVPQNP